MRKYGILGAALCLAAGVAGCSGDDAAAPPVANPFPPLPTANTKYFDVTDEAGRSFDSLQSDWPYQLTRSCRTWRPYPVLSNSFV